MQQQLHVAEQRATLTRLRYVCSAGGVIGTRLFQKAMSQPEVRIATLGTQTHLDLNRLATQLNKFQSYYHFISLGNWVTNEPPDIPNKFQRTVAQIARLFHARFPQAGPAGLNLVLTGEKLEDEYFSLEAECLGVISIAGTDLIREAAGKSVEKYFAYLAMAVLLSLECHWDGHPEDADDVGCLFDSDFLKRDNLVRGLDTCTIEDGCLDILSKKGAQPQQIEAVEKVLGWVNRPSWPTKPVSFKWGASATMFGVGAALVVAGIVSGAGFVLIGASGWVAALPVRVFKIFARQP